MLGFYAFVVVGTGALVVGAWVVGIPVVTTLVVVGAGGAVVVGAGGAVVGPAVVIGCVGPAVVVGGATVVS